MENKNYITDWIGYTYETMQSSIHMLLPFLLGQGLIHPDSKWNNEGKYLDMPGKMRLSHYAGEDKSVRLKVGSKTWDANIESFFSGATPAEIIKSIIEGRSKKHVQIERFLDLNKLYEMWTEVMDLSPFMFDHFVDFVYALPLEELLGSKINYKQGLDIGKPDHLFPVFCLSNDAWVVFLEDEYLFKPRDKNSEDAIRFPHTDEGLAGMMVHISEERGRRSQYFWYATESEGTCTRSQFHTIHLCKYKGRTENLCNPSSAINLFNERAMFKRRISPIRNSEMDTIKDMLPSVREFKDKIQKANKGDSITMDICSKCWDRLRDDVRYNL